MKKLLENKISLREHLVNQINIDFKDSTIKTIAIRMIDFLHPSGWFITPVDEVAKDLNVDISIIKEALDKLKHLEPSGIFAENLSECLGNQLKDLNYIILHLKFYLIILTICHWEKLNKLVSYVMFLKKKYLK